jgi:hypothetical protein
MAVSSPDITAPPEAGKMLKLLLETIQAEDHEAFLAFGAKRFQQGISKAMFFSVSQQVASHLKAGYTTEFLTELNPCEHRGFLWKLSFSDAANQFITRLVLTTDGKVAGFMLSQRPPAEPEAWGCEPLKAVVLCWEPPKGGLR